MWSSMSHKVLHYGNIILPPVNCPAFCNHIFQIIYSHMVTRDYLCYTMIWNKFRNLDKKCILQQLIYMETIKRILDRKIQWCWARFSYLTIGLCLNDWGHHLCGFTVLQGSFRPLCQFGFAKYTIYLKSVCL